MIRLFSNANRHGPRWDGLWEPVKRGRSVSCAGLFLQTAKRLPKRLKIVKSRRAVDDRSGPAAPVALMHNTTVKQALVCCGPVPPRGAGAVGLRRTTSVPSGSEGRPRQCWTRHPPSNLPCWPAARPQGAPENAGARAGPRASPLAVVVHAPYLIVINACALIQNTYRHLVWYLGSMKQALIHLDGHPPPQSTGVIKVGGGRGHCAFGGGSSGRIFYSWSGSAFHPHVPKHWKEATACIYSGKWWEQEYDSTAHVKHKLSRVTTRRAHCHHEDKRACTYQ